MTVVLNTAILNKVKSFDQSLDGVTRLCLGTSAGCFLVGGAFLAADIFVPVGPRGPALVFVGCFFLAHGLYELGKGPARIAGVRRANSVPARTARGFRRANDSSEPNEHAAA